MTVSSIIAFSLLIGMSIAANADAKVIAPTDDSFMLAQTGGMERRQDRRDTRQDCRSEGGLMGADKRNCKQDKRSDDGDTKDGDTKDNGDTTDTTAK